MELVCKLGSCPDRRCPGHGKTKSPVTEVPIALPKWAIGWDVLSWIGHRRCSRHWSTSQIDAYRSELFEDSPARHVRHYQNMSCADRQADFEGLIDRFQRGEDSIHQKMAGVMIGFLAGLFVGAGKFEDCDDNLDLERWFRLPKSHERRIHGHRHAGIWIVQEGPTLVHALDAHLTDPEPFTVEDLLPYRAAKEPLCQKQAIHRRKIMRKARSKTARPLLLADMERRY